MKGTYQEFQDTLEAVPDKVLVRMGYETLSELCSTGGKSFTMTVPPKIKDTDMLFSEIIRRFERTTK
jgi:hypothetical protein